MATKTQSSGVQALRKDVMMTHLLDSLDAGKDIGHHGRLVFTMIARHFLPDEELIETLAKDHDFGEDQARALVQQVKEHDYSPPRREKILDFQSRQEFPIVPNSDDPDSGDVYRDLEFPEAVYEHIAEYREHKAAA